MFHPLGPVLNYKDHCSVLHLNHGVDCLLIVHAWNVNWAVYKAEAQSSVQVKILSNSLVTARFLGSSLKVDVDHPSNLRWGKKKTHLVCEL